MMNRVLSYVTLCCLFGALNTWEVLQYSLAVTSAAISDVGLKSLDIPLIEFPYRYPLASSSSYSDSDQQKNEKEQPQPQQKPQRIFPEPTFMLESELKEKDYFAAAWWMKRERFSKVAVSEIKTVEGDVFIPILFGGNGRRDVRMARDWLDFSLEHLSKWQKMFNGESGNKLVERICQKYITNRQVSSGDNDGVGGSSTIRLLDTYMNSTLAVIPYGVPDKKTESVQGVWAAYLAVTITSLVQHGVKRVVVVGYYDMDVKLAAQAFDLLLGKPKGSTTSETLLLSPEFQLASTELTYVHTNNVLTKFIATNVPFGALAGLQGELRNRKPVGLPEASYQGSFLGKTHNASDFDYIYMTEADQILHARLSPTFWDELDRNHVVVPHRLQPIPHYDDLAPILDDLPNLSHGDLKALPDNHAPPLTVDPENDACCDNPDHYGEKTCGAFWWMCGFGRRNKGLFSHFDPFDFMKLSSSGAGIVTLAGNEHGRQCRVKPNGRGTCTRSSGAKDRSTVAVVRTNKTE